MTILNRLVFKEWISSFISAVLVLIILVTAADLINGFLRSSVTAVEVIKNYILKLPFLFAKIIPVGCLIATLFGLHRLKNKNELLAILASGYTRKNLIFVLLKAASLAALAQFLVVAYAEPYSKRLRKVWLPNSEMKFRNDGKTHGLSSARFSGGYIWFKSKDYFVNYVAYDKQRKELVDLSLYFFDQNFKTTSVVKAKRAKYQSQFNWELSHSTQYNLDENQAFPKIKSYESLVVPLRERDSDFLQIESDLSTLGIMHFYKFIKQLKQTGINTAEYEIILFDKFASTLLCFIFSLCSIGVLFSPNRRQGGLAKSAIYTFVFIILYWLLYSSLMAMGSSGQLHPLLATFILPCLFSIYLVALFYKHRRI